MFYCGFRNPRIAIAAAAASGSCLSEPFQVALSKMFEDPRHSSSIHSRCGGDGCVLKLDTWTKSPELIISFLKDHTEKCPLRPIFCPRGTNNEYRLD